MAQGDDDAPPGERLCPQCNQRWYSAALLSDDSAVCPQCGTELTPAPADD